MRAFCFDASLGLVGADEAKGETADDGHVLGAVAAAVARQIVLERNVKQPVHGFYAPVPPDAAGDPLNVEGGRRDVEALVQGAAVLEFGAVDNLNGRFDVVEL